MTASFPNGHSTTRIHQLRLWSNEWASDPRTGILLTLALSSVVWSMSFLMLCVYFLPISLVWIRKNLVSTLPPQTLKRTFFLCLLWPALKLIVDGISACYALSPAESTLLAEQPLASIQSFLPALTKQISAASVLFCRLLLLMVLGLTLTAVWSPRALGLALTWFIRPLSPANAWKPALALALMAQYLPLIHRLAAQLRTGIQARGLPARGLTYWRLMLPQLFRLLYQRTYAQAIAITCRHLNAPDAWNCLPAYPAFFFIASALSIIAIIMTSL